MTNILNDNQPVPIFSTMLPSLDDVYLQLNDVWSTRQVTNNGTKLKLLEQELQKILGVNHVSLINNGMIALMLAVKALNLSGEVITTPFTFVATTQALSWNNIQPVFCDINYYDMTIDVNKIEALITNKTTGILPVHVYGIPCNFNKIQNIANKYHLKIIYDAAHAFCTKINNIGIGNFGDITMFSCHATKLFNTAEGGILTCDNFELKQKINELRNFGIVDEETIDNIGLNGKLNEIQAAIGLENCKLIEQEWTKRKLLFDIYNKELEGIDGLYIFKLPSNVTNSLQYYPIRCIESVGNISRDDVYLKLKKQNIFTRKYFYPLCSNFKCYKNLPSSLPSKLPVANKVASEILCLPLHGALKTDKVYTICKTIKSLIKGKNIKSSTNYISKLKSKKENKLITEEYI